LRNSFGRKKKGHGERREKNPRLEESIHPYLMEEREGKIEPKVGLLFWYQKKISLVKEGSKGRKGEFSEILMGPKRIKGRGRKRPLRDG